MFKKALAASAASALMFLSACGASEVDIPVVEADIKSGIEDQLGEDATADCPEQVDWQTGESFTCDVEFSDGSTQPATVEMVNDDGEVNWSLGPAE